MEKGEFSGTACEADLSNAEQPKRKKNPKGAKPALVANVLNTEYSIVKEVLKDVMKCKLSHEAEDDSAVSTKDWDIYWNDLAITPELLSRMKPYQKVNHFPGMESLSRKNLLGKHLNRMKKFYPKEYSFFPTTWLLPSDYNDFKRQFQKKTKIFIVKPEAKSQGKGIRLVKSWTSIRREEHCVVQKYIGKPFLIDGLKFDLRIYVLVYGCDPYRIFVHREGLARLATEQYSAPKSSNLKNSFIHLTNYAINKNNAHFEYNVAADNAAVGHKRSLEFVWEHIRRNGGDPEKVKRDIQNCIVKTFCTVQPLLAHIYKSCQPNDFANNKCFEILGFDILLDHKLKPWLLEVNQAPSFSTDTPFDKRVKAALLEDTFKLIHLNLDKKISHNKKKNAIQQTRLAKHKGPAKKLTADERVQKRSKKMAKRDAYELEHLGNYEVAYPDAEFQAQYAAYIRTAGELWDLFTGGRRKESVKKTPEVNRKSTCNRNELPLMRPHKKVVAESKSFIVKTRNEIFLKESTHTQEKPSQFSKGSVKTKGDAASPRLCGSVAPRHNRTEHKQRSGEEGHAKARLNSAYESACRANKSATGKHNRLLGVTRHKDSWKPNNYGLYVVPKMIELTHCPLTTQPKVPVIYQKLVPQHIIFKGNTHWFNQAF